MKKFSAFTLAEVLITLGIIGVVAAMTMPTLINQTNGAQYRAAFKKELSVISQAVTLNVALEDWDFADIDGTKTLEGMLKARTNVVRSAKYSEIAGTKSGETTSGGEGYSPIIDLTGLKQDVTPDTDDGKTHVDVKATAPVAGDKVLMFNDGSMFIFTEPTAGCTEKKPCQGWFDVNGMKGPNKLTKCDGGTNADTCSVKIPTDIFPVKFYDRTILPNSGEGRAVLYDNGNTASQK